MEVNSSEMNKESRVTNSQFQIHICSQSSRPSGRDAGSCRGDGDGGGGIRRSKIAEKKTNHTVQEKCIDDEDGDEW